MDISFIVGILLAIPLAIMANLLTPKIQLLIDKNTLIRTKKRTKELQKEFEIIKDFYDNREKFREFLLLIIIKTTFIGSIVGLLAGVMFIFSNLFHIDTGEIHIMNLYTDINRILVVIGEIFTLFGTIIVINIAIKGLKYYSKVNNFESFKMFYEKFLLKKEKEIK